MLLISELYKIDFHKFLSSPWERKEQKMLIRISESNSHYNEIYLIWIIYSKKDFHRVEIWIEKFILIYRSFTWEKTFFFLWFYLMRFLFYLFWMHENLLRFSIWISMGYFEASWIDLLGIRVKLQTKQNLCSIFDGKVGFLLFKWLINFSLKRENICWSLQKLPL